MTAPRRRVVFVHSSNEMFGADRVLLQVVDSLARHPEFDPVVWLPDDVTEAADSIGARLRERGVPIRVLPLPILRRAYISPRGLPGLAQRTAALWARLLRERPAVVYCATSAALLAAPAARLAGVRVVAMHQQEIWSASERRLLGMLAHSCSHIVAISSAARGSLGSRLRARTRTIHNAVADAARRPTTGDGADRVETVESHELVESHDRVETHELVDSHERAGTAETGPALEFLMAGRWNSRKGHGTLLDAWNRCDPPPGHLTIVGSPPEIGASVDVHALVRGLRSPHTVSVVGQVDDISPWIESADVMLVPSDEPEGLGLVAIEAFSRSTAVIGSDDGGLREIVTSGENGVLVPPRDPIALARVLSTVDREVARHWGEHGRRTFEQRFSLDRFEAAFDLFWAEVATSAGVGASAGAGAGAGAGARIGVSTGAPRRPAGRRSIGGTRLRLYDTLRSAHLERAHLERSCEVEPATILYGSRRYDFAEELAVGLPLVRAGVVDSACLAFRSRVEIVEINEPLMLSSLVRSSAVLLALTLRRGRPRVRVVTYAIANADPFASPPPRTTRGRVRRRLDILLARRVWSRVDRIVFGTPDAAETYRRALGGAGALRVGSGQRRRSRVILALPSPATSHPPPKTPRLVAFVGAFSTRKGFDLLAAAWPGVVESEPGARLIVLGTGALEGLARELAAEASVDLVVDPERSTIHEWLERASILVLPSQRTALWREQVGLPIVEGLSHGCEIVTTSETGLARWLSTGGHTVIPPGGAAADLTLAILRAIVDGRDAAEILGSLPAVDGRRAAEEWLFAPEGADSDDGDADDGSDVEDGDDADDGDDDNDGDGRLDTGAPS